MPVTTPSLNDIDIIIALGNPGHEYIHTYHNAGVQFVDFLTAADIKSPLPDLIPLLGSYMNESGPLVQKVLKKSGITPDKLLLVHDDVDIPLGEYKFSFGSGAAGHHVVESTIASLGTKDFWRLRIGIAKTIETPEGQRIKLKADTYVLKQISQKDLESMHDAFKKAADQLSQ